MGVAFGKQRKGKQYYTYNSTIYIVHIQGSSPKAQFSNHSEIRSQLTLDTTPIYHMLYIATSMKQ